MYSSTEASLKYQTKGPQTYLSDYNGILQQSMADGLKKTRVRVGVLKKSAEMHTCTCISSMPFWTVEGYNSATASTISWTDVDIYLLIDTQRGI